MKLNRLLLAGLASGFVAIGAAAPASAATTIFDSGAPAGGGGPAIGYGQQIGSQFVLDAATVMTSLETWTTSWVGTNGPSTVNVKIVNDASNLPGNTALYSGSFSSVGAGTWQGLSGLNWALDAGTYWVTFSSTTSSSILLATNTPTHLRQAVTVSPNVWSTYYGSVAVRAQGNVAAVVAAVPEPATWGMMIVGFGMVGASMRRRKVAIRFA